MSQAAYQRVASASHGILAILVFVQHPKIKSLIYVTKTKLNKEDNIRWALVGLHRSPI